MLSLFLTKQYNPDSISQNKLLYGSISKIFSPLIPIEISLYLYSPILSLNISILLSNFNINSISSLLLLLIK